jgi:hypothetical protein
MFRRILGLLLSSILLVGCSDSQPQEQGSVIPIGHTTLQAPQGLYQRTKPLVDGTGAGIRPLAKDPAVAGRFWAVGEQFGQIGYSSTDQTTGITATFVPKTVNPASASGVQSLLFTQNYAWLTVSGITGKSGKVYRSPKPNANGNGFVWTLVFDQSTNGGGTNSSFRNSNVAVKEPYVYVLEYSIAPITGGPSLFVSDNNGTSFVKTKTWTNAKHGHAVQVINGVPWVMLGDAGSATGTDIGLWRSSDALGTSWSRVSSYGEGSAGNTLTGINFQLVSTSETINGTSVTSNIIYAESDTSYNTGPLALPLTSLANPSSKPFLSTSQMPPMYAGTIRAMTYTSEKNLMWLQTGEGGDVGPYDSIWIAAPPFYANPVLLETLPASLVTFGSVGDPFEDGQYIWIGMYRLRKEQL